MNKILFERIGKTIKYLKEKKRKVFTSTNLAKKESRKLQVEHGLGTVRKAL